MSLHRYTRRTFFRELLLVGGAALFVVPLYFVLTLSVKSSSAVALHPLSFPTSVDWQNFSTVWTGTGGIGVGSALVNSAIITSASVAALIGCGAPCAWVIARRASALTTGLYYLFAVGVVMPAQLGLIPIYVVVRDLHLVGTDFGMILLECGVFMPLVVFLYAGFIRAVPREYEEAAHVDGAGLVRTFARVVFPLLRPVTASVSLVTGIFIWNDFYAPLVFLSGTSHVTLPVEIYSYIGEYGTEWNLVFAAIVLSLLPMMVFYVVAQRQLIKGFSGGLRG